MYKFVLDRHEAKKRGLHFDLRFSKPNSSNWDSFSLNQMPPTKSGERKYIVRTVEHSEKNALFTGKIEEGYGAGEIKRIDSGECDILKYSNSHMVVDFKGKKLNGIYHFINTANFGRNRNYSKKLYSFFKAKNQNLNEDK